MKGKTSMNEKGKQLRFPFEMKDVIFNLSEETRKELISDMIERLTWVNYERHKYNELEHYRLWQFIKHNPETACSWIEEFLSKE